MTTTSPEAARESSSTPSSRAMKAGNSKRQGREKAPTVSWYGTLLIVGTLSLAAGWEIFRWILTIIALD